ncbi:MAG: twitching motility protein PilT [Actinomycetota bacterium]|nr:twitching motility protein PilT [Actinomycetota bacterium]
MNPAVYDAGALVAADRNARSIWAEHRVRLEAGVIPCVPAPVIAQVSRSGRQAQLRRFLRGCDVVDFREVDAHATGRLLARSRTSDIVDAAVVVLATDRAAEIVTADRADITHLLVAARISLPIVDT